MTTFTRDQLHEELEAMIRQHLRDELALASQSEDLRDRGEEPAPGVLTIRDEALKAKVRSLYLEGGNMRRLSRLIGVDNATIHRWLRASL